MSNDRMPAAFIGHGSPMNTLDTNGFTQAWRALGEALPRPRAVLAVSAHWFIQGTAVTAIVCASDPLALGVIRAVRRAGLRVPEDISVVGYDDSALMGCVEPPLTTVRQPIEPMGRMVMELLTAQMTGERPGVDEFLFEPELVLRGSTGPARN